MKVFLGKDGVTPKAAAERILRLPAVAEKTFLITIGDRTVTGLVAEDSNVTILVIDANAGVTDQDLSLLSFIIQSGRSLVIAVNKWDGLDKEVKEKVKQDLELRLGFVDFAEIHFISALHGTGVGHLFESILSAYKSATTRVPPVPQFQETPQWPLSQQALKPDRWFHSLMKWGLKRLLQLNRLQLQNSQLLL